MILAHDQSMDGAMTYETYQNAQLLSKRLETIDSRSVFIIADAADQDKVHVSVLGVLS